MQLIVTLVMTILIGFQVIILTSYIRHKDVFALILLICLIILQLFITFAFSSLTC